MTDITDATFLARLKTDLALTNGSGSATFTRTTNKDVFDNEGKLISIKSGAIGFGGARCVQNLFAASATLSTQGVAVTAKTYTVSFYGAGTIAFSGAYAGADLVGTSADTRVQRTFTATAGTLTCTVTGSCTNAQLENVTGQADQTASEYVDSATDYGAGTTGIKYFNTNKNGSAIESSAQKGVLIDPASKTNTMLHSRNLGCTVVIDASSSRYWIPSTIGETLVTNGTFTSGIADWTGVNCTLTHDSGVRLRATTNVNGPTVSYFYTTIATEIGETYVLSVDWVTDAMSGSLFYRVQSVLHTGTIAQYGQTGPSNTTYSLTFTATTDITYFTLYFANSSLINDYITIDNVSCHKAGVKSTLTGDGVDGGVGNCTVLEFLSNNSTIMQTITAAASAGCSGFWIKRHTGVGAIEITRDGVSWTDITEQLSTNSFYAAKIEDTSVTNPVVGIRGGTAGDKIIVDAGLNHLGTQLCEPIFTTTAAVTRNAEALTVQTSGNFSDTAGTILATFTPLYSGSWPSGSIVGKAGAGLLVSSSSSGVQAADSTNTVSGATGAPANSSIRIGCRWSGSSLAAFSADPLLNVGAAGSYDGGFDLSTIAINPDAAGHIKDVAIFNTSLSDADVKDAWKLLDAQTFLPALSNLPIYNAGAIIHVEPDPPPVDPEPTPVFATKFQGWTVGADGVENPQVFIGTYACSFQFTGSDSVTGFSTPTGAPLYALSTVGGGGPGFGVFNNNRNSGGWDYPANTKAGVATLFTHDIVDTTVRGVATKALQLKFLAPGGASEFYQQAWLQIYRNVSGNPDLPESTTRFEIKLPDLSTVLPYTPYNGRLIVLDYKSSGDFRYLLQVTRYGVSSYRWQFEIDNNANVTSGTTWCFMLNSTETVPQNENFTVDFSFKRANAYATVSGVNAGKARVRIRRESDSVTTWRTLFDASESGIAAYNAINGSSNINRHMGINTSKMQRLFHGSYSRKLNADCAVEIAHFRMFDTFDV